MYKEVNAPNEIDSPQGRFLTMLSDTLRRNSLDAVVYRMNPAYATNGRHNPLCMLMAQLALGYDAPVDHLDLDLAGM
jgi:hypothetical protein